MPESVILTCALIVFGRILDVSLGTLRVLFVVRGERLIAAGLGFVEVLIWVVVVSRVVTNLDEPIYFVAYAVGFSLGTYTGMLIEARIASGRQVVRIFTRRGGSTANALRERGYIVTEFAGEGRAGRVSLLFLETARRSVGDVLMALRSVDPDAYPIVDDVRTTGRVAAQPGSPWAWLALRRK